MAAAKWQIKILLINWKRTNQQLQKVSLEWQVKSKKNSKDNAMLECYAFVVKMEI